MILCRIICTGVGFVLLYNNYIVFLVIVIVIVIVLKVVELSFGFYLKQYILCSYLSIKFGVFIWFVSITKLPRKASRCHLGHVIEGNPKALIFHHKKSVRYIFNTY